VLAVGCCCLSSFGGRSSSITVRCQPGSAVRIGKPSSDTIIAAPPLDRSVVGRVVVNSAAVFGSPILCFRTNESPPDDVQTDGFAVESFPKSAEGNAGQAGAGSFSSRNSAALRVFSRARAWEESLIISSSTRSAGCARKEKKTTDGGGGGAAP